MKSKYERVQLWVDRGRSVREACEKVGIVVNGYYAWRARRAKNPLVPTKRKSKALVPTVEPYVEQVAVQSTPGKVAVMIGNVEEIAALLGRVL